MLPLFAFVLAVVVGDVLEFAAEDEVSEDGAVLVLLEALGEGVVELGVTVVDSREAVVEDGVVEEVVLWRSQAARAVPSARAATRGISFMFRSGR